MGSRRFKVYRDRQGDILDVRWGEGAELEPTDTPGVMERLDGDGRTVGFQIHYFDLQDQDPVELELEVGGGRPPGLVNVTARRAAQELGITYSRMRQLLKEGRVRGASKLGQAWVVPSPVEVTPGSRGPVGIAGEKTR